MLFDPVNSQIFTLGRYLDNNSRTNINITVMDFFWKCHCNPVNVKR